MSDWILIAISLNKRSDPDLNETNEMRSPWATSKDFSGYGNVDAYGARTFEGLSLQVLFFT